MDERSEWTGEKIRKIELARAYLGGLDEAATRALLASLAASVDEAAVERSKLAQRVKELEAALDERVPEVSPEGYTEQALSHLIRDARQKFDDLLQQANEEAANVKAAAAIESEQLLDETRVGLQRTQESAQELHQLLVETSNRLVEALETARSTAETLAARVPAHASDVDLVKDLWPTEAANPVSSESAHAPDEEPEQAEVPSAVSGEASSGNDNSR